MHTPSVLSMLFRKLLTIATFLLTRKLWPSLLTRRTQCWLPKQYPYLPSCWAVKEWSPEVTDFSFTSYWFAGLIIYNNREIRMLASVPPNHPWQRPQVLGQI